MPITKKLIEKMGGTITFESEKGVGTTFMIQIPFRIDTEADTRIKQEERPKASIQGLHILLVEDNALNMEIAEFVLENEGAIVIKAKNGKEAVDIFQSSGIGECHPYGYHDASDGWSDSVENNTCNGQGRMQGQSQLLQ